jgi:hypothetical protein
MNNIDQYIGKCYKLKTFLQDKKVFISDGLKLSMFCILGESNENKQKLLVLSEGFSYNYNGIMILESKNVFEKDDNGEVFIDCYEEIEPCKFYKRLL